MVEKEYIERNDALDIVKRTCGDYATAFSEIRKLTAADVAPVRHGYWVKEKRDVLIHWHCSACKECYYLDMPNAKYCPHCGAKMDLKEM